MSAPDPNALADALTRIYGRREVIRAIRLLDADRAAARGLACYRDDPVGFATNVLGVSLTDDQRRILQALPGRVKIESGHNVGKSFIMAVICHWWVYTRDPSVVICNAPTKRSVEDVLWVEIRLLWQRSKTPLPNYFAGPKVAEMYHTPDHWAKGYTTSTGEGYQGRHRDNMLFLFDEDEDIDPVYWTVTSTMYQEDRGHCWVASCNPITTSTQSYIESLMSKADGSPKWKLFRLSSLDHPNVKAELDGKPAPIHGAVSIGQVNDWVRTWTTRIEERDRKPTDLEWPPKSGKWYRPGPTFKGRVLGIRPEEGVDTVFSLAAFELMLQPRWDARDCWLRKFGITVGCDPAAYGDDDTGLHVRSGPLSLHHEAHNGWGPGQVAGRIKELCDEWSQWYNQQASEDRPPITPKDVDVTIELDGGLGVGVMSHGCDTYPRWRGVTVGEGSERYDMTGRLMYANVRAEVWIEAAQLAAGGMIDISRLPPEVKERMRLQLLTPFYEVKPNGSRLVEPKDKIKERLGRSPDDAEALILSHHRPLDRSATVILRA